MKTERTARTQLERQRGKGPVNEMRPQDLRDSGGLGAGGSELQARGEGQCHGRAREGTTIGSLPRPVRDVARDPGDL